MKKTKKKSSPHALTQEQIQRVKLWIKELRSGKHKQTREVLGNARDGYCCLGVACSRVTKNLGQHRKEKGSDPQTLNDKTVALFGLNDEIGQFTRSVEGVESLVELNDELEWSFAEIADFIERNLRTNGNGLFK